MTAKIKLNAASGGGSVSLEAPTSTTGNANIELKLPVADGSGFLKSDGSGNLSTSLTTSGTDNFTIADGNLVIGTSGHGIDFSAGSNVGGMTSELLDGYEEGTWTPSSGVVGSIGIGTAHYVKIGSLVTAQAYIVFPSMSGSAGVNITNFPYSASGNDDYYACAVNSNANVGSAQLIGQLQYTSLALVKPDNNMPTVTQMSGKFVLFSITYSTH